MFLTSPIFGPFGLSSFFNGILPLNAYGMPKKLDPSFLTSHHNDHWMHGLTGMPGITAEEKVSNRECSIKVCPLKASAYFKLP